MIRPATKHDIQSLAIIQTAAWGSAYRGLFPDEIIDGITKETSSRNWKRNIADPNRENLLYEENGKILGFISYGPSREKKGEPAGEVIACYVHPEAWRRGIGRSLWAEARPILSSRFGHVIVWVLRDNHAARAFYESIGFSHVDGSDRPLSWCADVIEVCHTTRLQHT